MNELKIFAFEDKTVRTLTIDGNPWFVGKDVADILGYSNPQKAIRDHVDEEDRRGERIVHPSGGAQETVIINESGLYSLILFSKLPGAKKFKRWVTSEVLPEIRKGGLYTMDELLDNPDMAITALTKLKAERSPQIDDPIKRAELWIEEQKKKRMLNQKNGL